jgi:hypothetical protein
VDHTFIASSQLEGLCVWIILLSDTCFFVLVPAPRRRQCRPHMLTEKRKGEVDIILLSICLQKQELKLSSADKLASRRGLKSKI